MDKFAYEVRLIRVNQAPKVAGRRRWRWDLTVQEKIDAAYPGVKDLRFHQTAYSGYTFTRLGALWSIGKAYDRVQERFPIHG